MSPSPSELLSAAALASAAAVASYVVHDAASSSWRRDAASARIAKLVVYPVKSLAGAEVDAWPVTEHGLLHDRRFMLVSDDDARRFVSARKVPRLLALRTSITEDGELHVWCDGGNDDDSLCRRPLHVAVPDTPAASRLAAAASTSSSSSSPPAPLVVVPTTSGADARRVTIDLWHMHNEAIDCGDDAARWFTAALGGVAVRLVVADAEFERDFWRRWYARAFDGLDAEVAAYPARVNAYFSDNFPLLLLSTASVRWVDAQLRHAGVAQPNIDWCNFRPNILVDGLERPFAEDSWRLVDFERARWPADEHAAHAERDAADTVTMHVLKACIRCVMTTIDQSAAARGEPLRTSVEPLRMLRAFRNGINEINERGPSLGQNVAADPAHHGRRVHVGSSVRVRARKAQLDSQDAWDERNYAACAPYTTPAAAKSGSGSGNTDQQAPSLSLSSSLSSSSSSK